MKLGKRLPTLEEQERTAIESMVYGSIGGFSKEAMPVVEVQKIPVPPETSGPWQATAVEQTVTHSLGGIVSFPDVVTDDHPTVEAGDVLGVPSARLTAAGSYTAAASLVLDRSGTTDDIEVKLQVTDDAFNVIYGEDAATVTADGTYDLEVVVSAPGSGWVYVVFVASGVAGDSWTIADTSTLTVT